MNHGLGNRDAIDGKLAKKVYPHRQSLFETWSAPLRQDEKQRENDMPPNGQTDFQTAPGLSNGFFKKGSKVVQK
jgi:hypothetical protein